MKKPFKSYNVTITVAGVDDEGEKGAEMKLKLTDIPRASVLEESYPKHIRELVVMLENSLE